jgi:4-amino-4-deoxychorismate lyase
MVIYFDKSYLKENDVVVNTNDLHFTSGVGFFEEILYNGVNICNLERHIGRIESSLNDFGFKVYSVDYRTIIKDLLNINSLENKSAIVNIYALAKETSDYSILIKVFPDKSLDIQQVSLTITPHKHLSYLNAYKTINYMHFYLAKQFANIKGFYDGLLVDSNNNILECSNSSIIFSDGEKFFTSKESNRLKSISLDIIEERYGLEKINIHIDSIEKYRFAFIVNSLQGSLPVKNINNKNFDINEEMNKNLRQLITN